MVKYITQNNKQTIGLGEKFAKGLQPGEIVLMYGDLGAGKTTFVQGVAKGLETKGRIISPTFVLHRIHDVESQNIKRINHIDLYRIENKLGLKELGLEEIFREEESATFIEWADRIDDLPEAQYTKIYFKDLGKDKREIVIEENVSPMNKAIDFLRDGGIVIYPTDTAFGIGCRIDNKKSIERLFKIRKRPDNKATPVLFDSIERVEEYLRPIDADIKKLMKKYWPGALTIILKCDKSKVPSLVRGGGETLGVRIPDHEIPRTLIKGIGVPIIGTSANFSGEPTPFSFDDLDKRLIKLVDLTLDGKTKGRRGLASTVIDCSERPWKIIRQGSITI